MSWSSCATSTFGSGSTSKPSTCRRTCSTSSGSWTAVPGQSSRSGTATSCSAVLCCAVAVRVCDVTSPSVFPYAPSPLGSQRTPHTQQAHVAHAIHDAAPVNSGAWFRTPCHFDTMGMPGAFDVARRVDSSGQQAETPRSQCRIHWSLLRCLRDVLDKSWRPFATTCTQ